MEDVTKLKKLADISTQDVSHREAELLKIQREAQQTVNAVKEKEHSVQFLETQVSQSNSVTNSCFRNTFGKKVLPHEA